MNVSCEYDHYLKYGEITERLKAFAGRYPGYARLDSLGKTEEGREIWVMALTDRKYGEPEEKPAYVAAGNIHAGEVTGSMNVMYLIDVLLTGCEEAEFGKILKDYTIYAIPRISPDGSEFYLTTGGMCRSVNKLYPRNELPPGIYGEDLDGDGAVRQMRFRDPHGAWKICKEDPRLMERRRPDEWEGEFYSVCREGKVRGNPKIHVFDAPDPYGNDFNRSFPINWQTDNRQNGAGPYPLYNTEPRAVADFLLSHPNICAFLNYHTCAGVCLYPPSGIPKSETPREDQERFREFAGIVTEETSYPAFNIHEQFSIGQGRKDYGSFDDFLYLGRGIASLTVECWDLDVRAGLPGKWKRPLMSEPAALHLDYEKKQLAWIDEHIGKDAFKPWTAFEHPQLGEVEIGGYDIKYLMQNPPVSYLQEEMEKCTRFTLRQVKTLPKIEIGEVQVRLLEEGFYEIEAEVGNWRYFPTNMTQEAKELRILEEDRVSLSGEEIEFLAGKPTKGIGFLPGMSGIHAANLFGEFVTMKQPLSRRLCWKIRGKKGTALTIRVRSVRSGAASKEVVLP